MKIEDVEELTKEYIIIRGEKIVFDEPFETLPSKEEYVLWLNNIKKVLEKTIVIKNR